MELIVLSAVGTTAVLLSELCGLVRGHLTRARRAPSRARWPVSQNASRVSDAVTMKVITVID
jgi:hypothetical protein